MLHFSPTKQLPRSERGVQNSIFRPQTVKEQKRLSLKRLTNSKIACISGNANYSRVLKSFQILGIGLRFLTLAAKNQSCRSIEVFTTESKFVSGQPGDGSSVKMRTSRACS
jgi:hypothetical protein